MRAVEQAWLRRQRRRQLFMWSAIGAVTLVAIGLPAIYFLAKVEYRTDVGARNEAARSFDKRITKTLAKDVDTVMRQSGLCNVGCAQHDPATYRWQWQIASEHGALLADLYAWQRAPESYRLIIYGLSPQPDGNLASEPRITQTLSALLERFGYPDAAQPFAVRDQDSGNSHYRTVGPKPVTVLWQPFPLRDRMRSQWTFNMLRQGPFTEEGSWLAER